MGATAIGCPRSSGIHLLFAGREEAVHIDEQPAQAGLRRGNCVSRVHVSFYRTDQGRLATASRLAPFSQLRRRRPRSVAATSVTSLIFYQTRRVALMIGVAAPFPIQRIESQFQQHGYPSRES
jgi:hypothetical protein